MATYRAAVNNRAGINTANSVLFQVRSGASGRVRIHEIVWTVATAPTNAGQLVIARATAVGTSSTTVAGQATDPADSASGGNFDSAWSSSPTFNTAGPFLFAVTLPATAGSVFYWTAGTSEEHIVLSASSGLVFAMANASGNTVGAHALQVAWDE